MSGVLDGLVVDVAVGAAGPDDRSARNIALQVLADLGAAADAGLAPDPTVTAPTPADRLAPAAGRLAAAPAGWSEMGGLPTGTAPYAGGLALAAAALLATASGRDIRVHPDVVTAHLLLPLVVAAATGTEATAAPPPPWPTRDGFVCADLGAEGDREAFDRLLRSFGSEVPGAEALAVHAQEWRLPVTPYRRRSARCPAASCPLGLGAANRPQRPRAAHPARPLAGMTVLDLTIMWAGPLCTRILAGLGATVLKIEPDCRLDGTRFSPGSVLFEALNQGKVRVPFDLRDPADHAAFFDLVTQADLVIDNFSPRVAPNLGVEADALQRANPDLAVLSLPAFPPGPERQWVSYGTGVHAWSGLGDVGDGTFVAPAVTYPDPLAGLAATVHALALLAAPRRDGDPRRLRAEVPLATAVTPLLSVRPTSALSREVDAALVARLAAQLGPIPPSPLEFERD